MICRESSVKTIYSAVSFLILICFFMIHCPLEAKGLKKSDSLKQSKDELSKAFFDTLKSEKQIFFYMAYAGIPVESLREIRNDLKNRDEKNPASFPRLSLRKNELTLNGQRTGIFLTSYSPMSIQYKGQTWAYDKTKLVESNYRALTKLLESKSPSAWMSVVLPTVMAQEWEGPAATKPSSVGASIVSAGINALWSLLGTPACLGFGPDPAAGVCIVAIPVGTFIGSLFLDRANHSEKVTEYERQQLALGSLFTLEGLELSCQPNSVELKLNPQDRNVTKNLSSLGIDRTHKSTKRPYVIQLKSSNGSDVPSEAIAPEQFKFLNKLATCKDSEDASKLMGEIHEMQKKFKEALATADTLTKSEGAPQKAKTKEGST